MAVKTINRHISFAWTRGRSMNIHVRGSSSIFLNLKQNMPSAKSFPSLRLRRGPILLGLDASVGVEVKALGCENLQELSITSNDSPILS